MRKRTILMMSLCGLSLLLASCKKDTPAPAPTPAPTPKPNPDKNFQPNIEGTEFPLMDFEHSYNFDAIVKHEAALGRKPQDFHDPEMPALPLYGFVNKNLTFVCAEYDIQDLRFSSKRIDVFVSETPDNYPKTKAMIHKVGFDEPQTQDGHTFWKKGQFLIVLVPYEVPDLNTHIKLEIIKLKDPDDFTGRALHSTNPNATDLPSKEIINSEVDIVKAYERESGWRVFRETSSPHPIFETKQSKINESNVAYMQYFKNFHGDTFAEAQLITLTSIMEVNTPEFMEWLKNNGYEPMETEGQVWTAAQDGNTMIMYALMKNDCLVSVRALPAKTGGFDFLMQIRKLNEYNVGEQLKPVL